MYVYTETIAQAAKLFTALGTIAQAGHFVSLVTTGQEVIITTSASQFEVDTAVAAVK